MSFCQHHRSSVLRLTFDSTGVYKVTIAILSTEIGRLLKSSLAFSSRGNMAASGNAVRVALIGVGPNYHGIPAEVRPILAKRLQAMGENVKAAGYEYELYNITPEDDIATLGPKLQSQRPDAVVIGNGVRSNMGLTHFMEQIIDTVRKNAPQAKLLFNTSPETTLDAVQRWFSTPTKSA